MLFKAMYNNKEVKKQRKSKVTEHILCTEVAMSFRKTLALKRLLGVERHCSEMLQWWFGYVQAHTGHRLGLIIRRERKVKTHSSM